MDKKHGPWTITSTKVAYANPWMQVVEDTVLRPDGKPGVYGVAHIKPGVSVLPIDENGNVYLTSEFHYAIGSDTVETVSGGIDDDEKPLDAAKRELVEELGITASELTDLGVTHPMTSVVDSPQYLFLARGLSFGADAPEGTEQIRLVKMPFAQAVSHALDGTIPHAPSCVLILRAKEHLKQ